MKKSIKLIVLLGLMFTISANSQNWFGKKIKSCGKEITEKRNTESYDGIKVSGDFDVDLIAGKEGEITVKSDESFMQYIKTEVKDNVLKIYTESGYNFVSNSGRNITITVPFESLNAVILSGSGNIKSESNIKSDKFSALLSGSGDMNLSVECNDFDTVVSGSGGLDLKGKSTGFSAVMSGSGNINAYYFETQNTDVTISGSADVSVFCTEKLKARISGSGDITYKGNPKIKDTKVSGSGEIKSE